jgi:hypothetical protein
MEETSEFNLVNKFISNDMKKISDNIKQQLMAFNLLEITGMGNQEIKHSNILFWMFGANEHNLKYKIFEAFLKKVIDNNDNTNLENLKSYVNLPKENITFYREKANIDLLAVDHKNKVVIVIENKIYAKERDNGRDGGQLKKYFDFIKNEYKSYKQFFIYLTIDKEMPSEDNQEIWLTSSHSMIGECVEEILKEKNDSNETILILKSYVDLLKRKNIMADKNLQKLCEEIWENPDYADAIDIINRYRTTNLDKLYQNLYKEFLEENKNESEYYIKTQVSELLYSKILNESWAKSKEIIFDLCIEKGKDYIWFGYVHHIDRFEETPILKELYIELYGKNSKPTKQKRKIMILENEIKNDQLEELTKKYILKFRNEILKFENIVTKILN